MSERRYTSLQNIFDIVDVKNGTFGLVYICTFRSARLAVKTLQDKHLGNEELVKNFYREAETWVKLGRHENIVRADCVLEIDQMPHIFMEYVDGWSLRDYMVRGGRNLRQVVDFAIQFCDGMIYVNSRDLGDKKKGIVHRDVKPENIMLTKEGVLKITDFGLVKALGGPSAETPAGTPEYMSPEQFRTMDVDTRSDIYSFGAVMYEMLTGRPPFYTAIEEERWNYCRRHHQEVAPKPPSQNKPDITAALEELVLKCLEKDPKNRYKRFEDLRTELVEAYQRSFGRRPEKKVVEGSAPLIDRSTLLGISLSSLGKMREALPWLDGAIEKNPRNVLAWHYKGEALDRMGEHADAIECFDEALRIDPKHAASWSAKADALGNLGRYEEAIQCYNKANVLKPMRDNHEFWSNKGLALVGLHKYKEATECFDKAIGIYPRSTKAWFGKALILEEADRFHEAIERYDRAIECDPRSGAAWHHKGNLLFRLGRFEEAIPCFSKALEINPRDVITWAGMGGALASLNRFEEAVRCCDKAIEIDPIYELAKRLREWIELLSRAHAETSGIVQELRTVKSKISELPQEYPTGAFTFGAGVGKAQEQIPVICAVIDDAVKALEKGLDVHNQPITRPQVADGLKRLVAATRRPAFVGLMSAVLSLTGINELEKHMNKIEQIASKIQIVSDNVETGKARLFTQSD